jgi:hypothetical protein
MLLDLIETNIITWEQVLTDHSDASGTKNYCRLMPMAIEDAVGGARTHTKLWSQKEKRF